MPAQPASGRAGDLWAVRCDNRDIERGFKLGSVELSLDDRASLECSLQPKLIQES